MSPEQFNEAVRLRLEGFTVAQTAAALGVSVGTLAGLLRRRGKRGKRTYIGRPGVRHNDVLIPWTPRKVRRIIKPAADVAELARQFAAGTITRAELVHGIRAE